MSEQSEQPPISQYKRVALFGGSFDPIQKAHVQIAELAKERFALDAVIFIPAKQNPFKGSPSANEMHRLNMIHLAIEENKAFQVSDFELRQSAEAPSYTIDTINFFLRTKAPQDKLFFIMGSDLLRELPKWKSVETLLGLLDGVICILRPPEDIATIASLRPFLSQQSLQKLQDGFLAEAVTPISSSAARMAIAESKDTAQFLNPKVARYILDNGLYQTFS